MRRQKKEIGNGGSEMTNADCYLWVNSIKKSNLNYKDMGDFGKLQIMTPW